MYDREVIGAWAPTELSFINSKSSHQPRPNDSTFSKAFASDAGVPHIQRRRVKEGLSAYSRLPERLAAMGPEAGSLNDIFGVKDRLRAIQEVLGGIDLGQMIDLGGNTGYFSMSLVDAGMASQSTVYDLNECAVSAGRAMAQELKIDRKVRFAERKVDLDFVRSMPKSDTIICLNLLHHAGTNFDVEEVSRAGWESYAERWLEQFRKKSRFAIVGLGFKAQKPVNWNIKPGERPRRLFELATRHGWSVLYDANVQDIHTLGVAPANGIRTRRGWGMATLRARYKRVIAQASPSAGKRCKYHLYILH